MRKVFFGARGMRSGWRLAIFIGVYAAILFGRAWVAAKIPVIVNLGKRPFLDPIALGYQEAHGLIEVLIATWVMLESSVGDFPRTASLRGTSSGATSG